MELRATRARQRLRIAEHGSAGAVDDAVDDTEDFGVGPIQLDVGMAVGAAGVGVDDVVVAAVNAAADAYNDEDETLCAMEGAAQRELDVSVLHERREGGEDVAVEEAVASEAPRGTVKLFSLGRRPPPSSVYDARQRQLRPRLQERLAA